MLDYLSADIRRLMRRFPRWLLILLALGGLSLLIILIAQLGTFGRWNSVTYVATIKKLSMPLALIIGVVELIFVFGDDLKARTMQASIGAGLPRAGLVASKFIEVILFSLLDILIFALFVIGFGLIFQANLVAAQYRELAICFFIQWLKVLGYTSLTMILIFFVRGVALGMVLYIAFFARIIEKAVSLLFSFGPMERLRLGRYTMSTFIDTLQTHLIGGMPAYKPLLAVFAYIVAGCLITALVFQKRELEF